MKKWLVVLFLSNVVDAAATLYVLSNSIDIEENPLARFLYSIHPHLFLVVKMGVLGIGVAEVISDPQKDRQRLALSFITIFYATLALFQSAVLISWWINH